MKEHAHLHRFYTSFWVRGLRLVVIIVLFVVVCISLLQRDIPKFPLFFLSIVMMWEIFFHFSLSRIEPKQTIEKNDGKNPLLSFTHEAQDVMESSLTVSQMMRALLHFPQVHFVLEKLLIEPRDFPPTVIEKESLVQKSYEVAKQIRGTYVTTMDILVAYLFLTEPETKILFSCELKPDDVYAMLNWARTVYHDEEHPHHEHFQIHGDGIGEGLVIGWTPETKHYTSDFTSSALAKTGQMIGRKDEYELLINALAKPEMRNVLLVGEPGVGKERLVAALARDSLEGNLPGGLNNKRVITLMVGQLMAGAANRAELEARLQTVIAELSHAGNIILSIPEMQEILGESSFDLNLSGALMPYLKDGSIPIIATITKGNYKTFLEKKSLNDIFSVITLEEPDEETAKRMICQKTLEIERRFNVLIPYITILQALNLSKNYLPDNVLPGSGIRLLTDATQNAGNEQRFSYRRVVPPDAVIRVVELKVHAAVAAPKKEEKQLLLHLETELHKRVIGQEHAIQLISDAIRRLRSGITKHTRPVSFLFLGPTGVGKTETAKALADLYFGGEEKMIRLDMSEYGDENSLERLLGAPSGAGEERGELTERIHDNPYTLVLLDEFEKAYPKVLDLFLQVLSDGRLTDNKGRTVTFVNAIIIATSNAASELIREEVKKGTKIDNNFQTTLLEYLQTNHLFKPELLNRFDSVVTFTPLGDAELKNVVKEQLLEVSKQLAEEDITLIFDDSVISNIIKNGSDEQFGARPLRRYIQDTIEEMLARLKLEEKVKRGDTIRFVVDESGKITTKINNN